MKTSEEITKEIKRLKDQEKKLTKESKNSGFAAGVTIAFRIVSLQNHWQASKLKKEPKNEGHVYRCSK